MQTLVACRGYATALQGRVAEGRSPHYSPPDAAQAEAHYQQGLAAELGLRPLQAHCQLGLGVLYAITGQRQQACTALATAIALYRATDMTHWLPQAEAALVQVKGS